MDESLLIMRVVLAGVFATAGLAKLADRAGSARALAAFGVPAPLARPLGVILPLVELATAAALVPAASARWGALAALALLVAFLIAIGVNVGLGRKPDCHCFGQLHSAPAGRSTLIRNAVLAVIAASVVLSGWEDAGPGALGWLSALSAGQATALGAGVFLLALVALEGSLLLRLLRQHGRLLLRLDALEADIHRGVVPATAAPAATAHGLPAGSRAPSFELPTTEGESVNLSDLLALGRPVLVVFTDPNCGPCRDLMPEVRRWREEHAQVMTVAVVGTKSSGAERSHGLGSTLLQDRFEVAEAYRYPGTPSAVLVGPDGLIVGAMAAGADAIRALVATTLQTRDDALVPPANPTGPDGDRLHSHARPEPPPVGSLAPAVRLPGLSGRHLDLADFRPADVLLVFWDPSCGFCHRLLPDLLAWEAAPPPGAPRLVLVSSGSIEANRGNGLTAPVLLDAGGAVRAAFGVGGTPIAVLIDGEGRVAADLGIGAQGVLRLAGTVDDASDGNGMVDKRAKEQVDG